MNAGRSNMPTDPVNRHIKLLRYTPRSGGFSRVFGAVWKRRDEVHWASPIVRRIDDVFDPQPFVARFPDAAYEFDHFVAAVAWLESVCYAAREPFEVAHACETETDLGLSCIRYRGPDRGEDLASLLGGEGAQAQLLDVELLRTAVSLTLEHLVKEHAVLKGLPLELISQGTDECARLHLPGDQIVRIYLDRDTPPGDVLPRLLVESDRLDREAPTSEVSFLVFAQLKTALPITPTTRVLATGMRLPHIANGLVRLVWSIPLSP
jgi:hypothetical protein